MRKLRYPPSNGSDSSQSSSSLSSSDSIPISSISEQAAKTKVTDAEETGLYGEGSNVNRFAIYSSLRDAICTQLLKMYPVEGRTLSLKSIAEMARSPKHSKTGGLPFMTIGGAIRRMFSSTTHASAAHDKGRQYLAFYGRVDSPWPEDYEGSNDLGNVEHFIPQNPAEYFCFKDELFRQINHRTLGWRSKTVNQWTLAAQEFFAQAELKLSGAFGSFSSSIAAKDLPKNYVVVFGHYIHFIFTMIQLIPRAIFQSKTLVKILFTSPPMLKLLYF